MHPKLGLVISSLYCALKAIKKHSNKVNPVVSLQFIVLALLVKILRDMNIKSYTKKFFVLFLFFSMYGYDF